jgi:hypothetical protein
MTTKLATTEEPKEVKKKPVPPDDFETAEAFLEHIRKTVLLDEEADRDNRAAAIEDSQFLAGDQWDSGVKSRRLAKKKPVLTENRLPALIGQVLGNSRLNETDIKIVPDNGGTKAIATVREGLQRNIQKNSTAKVAYDKTLENAVIGGLGNFQVRLDYACDDVFEQDIIIDALPNPFSVVWDRMRQHPTGKDAGHVTVGDLIPHAVFKKTYPNATPAELMTDADLTAGGWVTEDTVRVAAFWRMRSRKRTLALFKDGSVQDVTDKPYDPAQIVVRPDGTPVMREADRKYCEMYLVSGMDLLEGPYELPIDRVPVFRVPGWEVNVGDVVHRWGLVRWLKDPIRYLNYVRSVKAEKLMQSPKATWMARAGAVQGREKEWRASAQSDDPLMIFNDDAAEAPQRLDPIQFEQALAEETAVSIQVLHDISNLHEASLGQQSNEVSGKAIVARQRVGELGSVVYQDNLTLAKEEAGRVIDQLIPVCYDTPRIVRILGTDDKAALQAINDIGNPDSVDITLGKYSVSATTGPSYVTKRLEAQENMTAVFNAAPEAMAAALDLYIKEMDWPGSDKLAARIAKTLPPGLVDPEDMSDEQKQQMAAAQQAAQQKAQFEQQMAQAALAEAQAKVAEVQANTELKQAQAKAAIDNVKIKAAVEHVKSVSIELADKLAAIEVAEGNGKELTNLNG